MKKLLGCKCNRCIDLHIHSTASDGTYSPHRILLEAFRLGLNAISITDHDTLEGSRLALKHGIPGDMKFISGVEVSASIPTGFNLSNSVHVLGYGIQVDNPALFSCLESLRLFRHDRCKEILCRLASLGINISEQEILNEAGGGIVGRPHFANLMVKKGIVSSFSEAFDRFLGIGELAYVVKKKVNVDRILTLIKNAGGLSILAHPYLIGIKDPYKFSDFVLELKSMGLMGIEAIHPEHSREMSAFYSELARANGLLITGGTDFHGDNTPQLSLGVGKGNFCVPYALYEELVMSMKAYSI